MASNKYERYVQLFPKTFRPQDGDDIINNLPASETVGRTIAELWKGNIVNPVLNAVLRGFSEGDTDISRALEETKAQLFVKTASGQFLDVIASSLGVSRPSALGLSDEAFRNVTPALSLRPKQVRQSFYAAMDAFWGPEFTRANFDTLDQGTGVTTFDIKVGDTLSFLVDTRILQNIPIRNNTPITQGATTALQLNNLLNTSINGITSEIITDPITKIDSIRLRTNTPGLRGSLQFIDNRAANSRTLFPTTKTELINQTQRAVIYEITPNEVVVEIPAVVPTLARGLKGALHIHNGPLINNLISRGETTNYILPDTLFLGNTTNQYTVTSDQTWFTYDKTTRTIALSPPPNQEPDVYEFNVANDDDLTDSYRIFVRVIDRLNPPDNLDIWRGAFIFDPNGLQSTFTLSGQSALIQGDALTGQNQLAAGKVFPRVTVDPATNTLPDESGLAIIGFGTDTQEAALIRYRGKASDSVILLDPSFIFTKTQPADTYINIVSNASPFVPDRSGDAYPIYLTSSTQAREVIQGILETLAAAGVKLTFVIAAPNYKYLIDNPFLTDDGSPSLN